MAKKYYVDKNLVLGTLAFKGKTVKAFCEELGCSRVNFYSALNRGYARASSSFVKKVARALELKESLLWNNE